MKELRGLSDWLGNGRGGNEEVRGLFRRKRDGDWNGGETLLNRRQGRGVRHDGDSLGRGVDPDTGVCPERWNL